MGYVLELKVPEFVVVWFELIEWLHEKILPEIRCSDFFQALLIDPDFITMHNSEASSFYNAILDEIRNKLEVV